jgi:HSP90 family molecular chaperone
MRTISVRVQADHLERMTKVKRPILALAELLWNSLDADATKVTVSFRENTLGGLESVTVSDNGVGMPPEVALDAFGSLGGSWKRSKSKSGERGRLLHGRAGKGRFRAFSIGEEIEWCTRFQSNGSLKEYRIRGSATRIGTFEADDPELCQGGRRGTDVVLTSIVKSFSTLRGEAAAQALAEHFAIYLREYSDVEIVYDGVRLDPAHVEKEAL